MQTTEQGRAMTERIFDFSDTPVRLRVRYDNLVIESDCLETSRVPLKEIAVVVISHPQISLTHAVISGLAHYNAILVTCDESRLPVGMILPLQSHHVQTERFIKQAQASLPTRKRLWKQLVRSKITAQAKLLKELSGKDHGLSGMAGRVRSGDPANLEAQAARRYWSALLADDSFRRDPDGGSINPHLNYGYAVLRAITTRAICAAGLHPSLGLHHHNRYNAFCLADDLMEPFRPLVDKAVVSLDPDQRAGLDKISKRFILSELTGKLRLNGESRTLFDCLYRAASSLVAVLEGSARKLTLPEW